jgi:2-dehydro-3-deoxyphosphooctonate aldolase (KDO 8-P synthase)
MVPLDQFEALAADLIAYDDLTKARMAAISLSGAH